MRKVYLVIISVFLAVTFWTPACLANEAADLPVASVKTQQLKLNEAIDLALKNSKSLEKSKMEVEKAKEKKENASDAVDYAPTSQSASYNPQAEAAWYSLLSADLTWEMSKKTQTTEEDKLVLSICQKYWNVQKSQEAVRTKELALSVAEIATRRVQAMVRLGMTPPEAAAGSSPQAVLTSAEADLVKAKSSLEEARNKLNSDYEALNQLLGFWPDDRPVLLDEVKFETLQIDNLDTEVQRVLEKSPSIWQAEEKITLAKFAYEAMWASGQYTAHEIREIEKEQSEIDAITAKDAVKLATRGLYYTVRNLEAGIPGAEKAVALAEESLRVAKLQFELGMITRENLVKAESALAQARQTLTDLVRQHAYMKLSFQKPWAVSSSG